MKENTLLLRRNSVQNLFNGYYYDSSIAAIAGTKLSHISPENNAIISTEGKSISSYSKFWYINIKFNNLEGAKKQPKTINTSNITTKEIAAK